MSAEDVLMLQDLFEDFIDRARLFPDELLHQLSTLGVGPLVTFESGRDLARHPELIKLFEQFAQH